MPLRKDGPVKRCDILYIFYMFYIYFVTFERLIQSALKSVLLISLCENITITVQRRYIIIVVIKTLDTFWENILGDIN